MRSRSRPVVILWLVFMVGCGLVIGRTTFTADLSAFLPSSPSPEQELLLEQVHDGLASRLILVGIEGGDADTRARLSNYLGQQLRADPAFVSVSNGEPVHAERDRDFLLTHRYLLSPTVTADRFTADGLRKALQESIDQLASPAGLLIKALLPRDPTGEMLHLLGQLNAGPRPRLAEGVWASRDGRRALLLVQTRALGSDTDAQQAAMMAIRQAFASAPVDTAGIDLLMTGPGVFSVNSRAAIKEQVSRLSLISVVLIATLLLLVYRSPAALALGFLPVVSGAVAGVTAVSLGFGSVHGITLGFGTALIGEAVDYSIYLFVQSTPGRVGQQDWLARFWPTIRLGVLTSIFGFAALLLSGFPGLAQLGLYAVTGLIVAATVTRFVLPHLLPTSFRVHDVSALGVGIERLVRCAAALRWLAVLLLLVAITVLVLARGSIWDDRIASLSPVSQADVALDAELRAGLGAPDVRYLVVVSGPDRESVLRDAEQVGRQLDREVAAGALAGYESPARYLPSQATQRARRDSLPPPGPLRDRLLAAAEGLPVQARVFEPFLADVAAARDQPLLQAKDLDGTSMAMALSGMLIREPGHWSALIPLKAPQGGEIVAERIQQALATADQSSALFVDMKAESDRLYAGYLYEAIELSLAGLLAIVLLLLWVFRSPRRVLRVILPLAAAVATVAAGLVLFGQQLMILHLVGLLLVVAVGSNYALFFERADHAIDAGTRAAERALAARTLASMMFAGLTTVTGFGVLAFADVSLLKAMGLTVAPGVILALFYSAVFARRSEHG